ncbi:MAG TPA: hypothetical protein VK886_18890 [Vicinamibacterales bacterium]|nr:hypothetical protein [Vicinamibacterales bacterium]
MKRFQLAQLPCVVVLAVSAAACGGRRADEPAVASPSFSLDRPRVSLGSPVELSYRFNVSAPVNGDYRVFVHFLDTEEDLMWTDDHSPVPPTSQWKPGQTISYTRTIFVPIYPYVGETTVRVGLYSPTDGRRLALNGNEVGDREYQVATFTLAPQSENIFLIYRDGWNQTESAADQPALEWQWTKKSAAIAFRNPKRDVTFFLEADGRPDVFTPPQQVSIKVNDQVVHTFPMSDREPTVHRVPISAAQLGSGDMVDLKIEVDKTFVPSAIPAGQPGHGADTRELGIRVFHAFVGVKG